MHLSIFPPLTFFGVRIDYVAVTGKDLACLLIFYTRLLIKKIRLYFSTSHHHSSVLFLISLPE